MDVSIEFLNILAKITIGDELLAKEARNLPGKLSTYFILFLE
jgi:hypothetical protein